MKTRLLYLLVALIVHLNALAIEKFEIVNYTLVAYNDSEPHVVIPNGVEEIGPNVFRDNMMLKSVEIPATMKEIGMSAFANSGLVSIDIPRSVSNISESAFRNCQDLEVINVDPDNRNYSSINGVLYNGKKTVLLQYPLGLKADSFLVPSFIQEIGSFAFMQSFNLTNVTISDGVKIIAKSAFAQCRNLSSVSIPKSITRLGSFAFEGCYQLSRFEVKWEDPAELLFQGSDIFKSVSLGKSLLTVPLETEEKYRTADIWKAFSYISSSEFVVENGVLTKYFGKDENVQIPEGVECIGDYAFSGNQLIKTVTFSNSVVSIKKGAFHNCSKLTELVISKKLANFDASCVESCKSLVSIVVDSDNPAYFSEFGVLYNKEKTELVKYPQAKIGESFTIPVSVTRIGDKAFYSSSNLTSIVIPTSVKSVGLDAFTYCESLTSLSIEEGVESIGGSAFLGCQNLQSIFISSTVTNIGEDAFGQCYSLVEFKVDEDNESYCSQEGVLYNKSKTTLIRYPNVKSGDTFIIPSTVTSLDSYSVDASFNLRFVTIPVGVQSLGEGAFSNCWDLEEVTVFWNTPIELNYLDDVFNEIKNQSVLIVPVGTEDLYKAASVWGRFEIKGNTVSLLDKENERILICMTERNSILVQNAENCTLNVFNTLGKCVYSKFKISNEEEVLNLPRGIYVVKVDDVKQKLIVR